MICSEEELYTMWYLNYCVHLEHIWSFNSDLMFYLLIFDSFYNKELIPYLLYLDGEVSLAYCSVPRPESDYHIFRFLKLYLSTIRIDVFIY